MQTPDLIVEVRDINYNRVGQLLPKDLTDLTVVSKFNAVGSWKITLPADHYLVDALRTPGSGIIVTYGNTVILSGPSTSAKNIASQDDPKGSWEIEGKDDSIILTEEVAFPTPSTNDVTAQTVAYDTRIGKAETVIKEYISYNIGPDAVPERDVYNLTVDTDTALGSDVTASARFNGLDKLITSLASIDKLGYTIEQIGDGLVFKTYQPVDRSATIRMDIDNAQLSATEYLYLKPEVTRVIVGGKGTAEQRTFKSVETTESIAAAAEWGRKITKFKDARSAETDEELTLAGLEELTDKGITQKTVSITPNEYSNMQYGIDWGLGDIVSVTVNDEEIIQIVSEVGILVNSDGITIKATVGNPIKTDLEDTLIYLSGQQDDRLDNLERNAEAGATINRESVVYTTPALAPGQHFSTVIILAGDYRLQSISTTVECKVRLYTWETGRDLDVSRPTGGYPEENVGLMFEGETYEELLSWDLSPVVDGFTRDGNKEVPITITNTSSSITTPVQVTLIYIPLS